MEGRGLNTMARRDKDTLECTVGKDQRRKETAEEKL